MTGYSTTLSRSPAAYSMRWKSLGQLLSPSLPGARAKSSFGVQYAAPQPNTHEAFQPSYGDIAVALPPPGCLTMAPAHRPRFCDTRHDRHARITSLSGLTRSRRFPL